MIVNESAGLTSLETLVARLRAQKESRVDFVADLRSLAVSADPDGMFRIAPGSPAVSEFLPSRGLVLSKHALGQLADRLDVPVPGRFLTPLAEAHPAIAERLLVDLASVSAKRVLVRCLDGGIRAVLSDRYRVLDNYDLAFSALDAVRQHGGEVLKCFLSEHQFSLSFTTRQLWDRFNEGERTGGRGAHGFDRLDDGGEGGSLFHPLCTVSNSETGRGGLSVRYGILRARCVNSVLIEDARVERHLGGTLDAGFLREETISADSRAIMLKCQDAIAAGLHPATFGRLVALAWNATAVPVGSPSSAVAQVVEAFDLTEADRDSILGHFLRDYDPTVYGLSQAVARYAQDVPAETGYNLEVAAGAVLAKPREFAAA